MLSAKGLHCRRGGRTVLSSLSFELCPGQVLELRGANGSGKTSLLRVLAGLAPLSGGELLWNRRPQTTSEAHIAYLGHLNGLSTEFSATENLRFLLQLSASDTEKDVSPALQSWGLPLSDQPVRFLSQGQRRRLALARVWLARRTLWLLDEPCAALDSAGEALFDARLSEHLAAGGMAVVATHRALSVPENSRLHVDLNALPHKANEGMLAAC